MIKKYLYLYLIEPVKTKFLLNGIKSKIHLLKLLAEKISRKHIAINKLNNVDNVMEGNFIIVKYKYKSKVFINIFSYMICLIPRIIN